MTKEEIEKYGNKIHEVCLAGVLYPKETVIKTIAALVNEYADQQTKELQKELNDKLYLCQQYAFDEHLLKDKVKYLQAKIDELEKGYEDIYNANSENERFDITIKMMKLSNKPKTN